MGAFRNSPVSADLQRNDLPIWEPCAHLKLSTERMDNSSDSRHEYVFLPLDLGYICLRGLHRFGDLSLRQPPSTTQRGKGLLLGDDLGRTSLNSSSPLLADVGQEILN
jgi:hypothetical protein